MAEKKDEEQVAPAAIPGMYGDSPGVRAVKAVAGAVKSSQAAYSERSPLTVRPTLGPPAPVPPAAPGPGLGTAPGATGTMAEEAAAIRAKAGKTAVPPPPASAAPAAATKPSIADLSFNAENPTYKGPKLESQAKGYLDARMPNVGDSRVALPGGGYGSASDLVGPSDRPSIPAAYDENNPMQLQMRTGIATQVNPATLADVQAHWNPQQGASRGAAPNVFSMLEESLRGAVSSRFGGGGNGFGTDHPEVMSYDPQREARMKSENRSIIGPNGRISRSMVSLRKQEMEGADTRRGQDVTARGQDVTARGQDLGVFSESLRQAGDERRSLRTDETSRRGQDMGFQAGQEGRAAELEREEMGNRTSIAVAGIGLEGSKYATDQREEAAAAKGANTDVEEQTIRGRYAVAEKMIEYGKFDNPDGTFNQKAYDDFVNQVGAGKDGRGEKDDFPDGTKRRYKGQLVVKRKGQWVVVK